jgi:hypothetical protein
MKRFAAIVTWPAMGVLVLWATVACAANAPIPFLFSRDSQIKQSPRDLADSIESSSAIRGDKWLNAPLTRLDYVLMKIESRLNEDIPGYVQQFVREYFEPDRFLSIGPLVDISARYLAEKGRLLIIADIIYGGRPKKPMRDFCESVMGRIELSYPARVSGFAWLNNALGILMRDETRLREYVAIVQKLAESAVIEVSVKDGYRIGSESGFFQVTCMRQRPGGPIAFSKYSSKLSNKPR